jgi:hypothetical protein
LIGKTPILRRSARAGGGDCWAVRPIDALNSELSALYGLPIETANKRAGFEAVAKALERGDLALAQIAALLLQFPVPPTLAKAEGADRDALAVGLLRSGLIKGDWDPDKHPRTGTPPNPGWFAPKDDDAGAEPESREPIGRGSNLSVAGRVWRGVLQEAREILKGVALQAGAGADIVSWGAPEIKLAIEAAITSLEAMLPSELNAGEQQAIDQANSALDPAKTLEELQTPPSEYVLGYEQHHIVEQNPSNLMKTLIDAAVEKFGRDAIDDPSNIVWVPRLKHELISGYYSSSDYQDPDGRTRRQVVSDMDFDSQYEFGLQALRMFGVLQ